MLWFAMLIGQLWLYLLFELVILMAVFTYMRMQHEKLSLKIINKIESGHEYR